MHHRLQLERGFGKTTTALNLAAALAHRERRMLLVDLDPRPVCLLFLSAVFAADIPPVPISLDFFSLRRAIQVEHILT